MFLVIDVDATGLSANATLKGSDASPTPPTAF